MNGDENDKVYSVEVVVDPPTQCPEFGEWSGDPNTALVGKHDLVTISIESGAQPSLVWATKMIESAFKGFVVVRYETREQEK